MGWTDPLTAKHQPLLNEEISQEDLPRAASAEKDRAVTNDSKLSWWARTREAWWPEFIALVIAVVSLAAIVCLLAVYQGKPPPRDPSITLNAVISVLSAVATGMTGMVLGSSLAQMKWNHSGRTVRPLYDFYAIDQASKGPLGSISILFRKPISVIVTIAAIGILANQLVSSFLQQLLNQAPSQVPLHLNADNGSVPITQSFVNASDVMMGNPIDFDYPLKSAITNGFYAPNPSPFQIDPIIIPKTNATWSNWTLAACGQCTDVSDQLSGQMEVVQYEDHSAYAWNLSLPNGAYLQTLGDVMDFFPNAGFYQLNVSSVSPSIAFASSTYVLADYTVIYMQPNASSKSEAKATECILQYCAQLRNSSFVDGIFTDDIVSSTTFPASKNGSAPQPWIDIEDDDWHAYTSNFHPIDQVGNWSITDQYGHDWIIGWRVSRGIADFLRTQFLFGNMLVLSGPSSLIEADNTLTDGPVTARPIDAPSNLLALGAAMQGQYASGLTLTNLTSNIANALTQAMREHKGDSMRATAATAWRTKILVKVTWPWISFPLAVFLITIAMLCITIRETTKNKNVPWKDNVLASMAFGVNDSTKSKFQQATQQEELKKLARMLSMDERQSNVSSV